MSCISLAGWLSGVFKAVKLLYSFSTSGPSSTLNPISEKIDDISSIVWDTGWILPFMNGLSGKVISIFSFSSFSLISAFSISFIFELIKSCNSSFIIFKLINYVFPLRVGKIQEELGLNISEHNASTDTHELLEVLTEQAKSEDYSMRAPQDPFTDSGIIGTQNKNKKQTVLCLSIN